MITSDDEEVEARGISLGFLVGYIFNLTFCTFSLLILEEH